MVELESLNIKPRAGEREEHRTDKIDRTDKSDETPAYASRSDGAEALPEPVPEPAPSSEASELDASKTETPNTPPAPSAKLTKGKVIGLVIVGIIIWLLAVQIMTAERYQAIVNVIKDESQVGINPTTEILDFGDLSPGTAVSRYVSLKNNSQHDKFIWVVKFGEIADLLKVNEKQLTLKSGKEVKIEFRVEIPVSAPAKKYSGKVWIFKWPALWR